MSDIYLRDLFLILSFHINLSIIILSNVEESQSIYTKFTFPEHGRMKNTGTVLQMHMIKV